MGGFLQGLGELSTGLSKGISQETEDNARRAQARKDELANDAEQKVQDQQNKYEAYMKGFVPGQTQIGMAGAEKNFGDYAARVDAVPPPPTGLAALAKGLSSVFSKKNADATAIGAGVTDRPTLGVLPPPGGAPLAPAAAPPSDLDTVNAPQAGLGLNVPPAPSAPAAPAAPVKPITRPADEIDAALWRSAALARSGQVDKSIAEHQRASDMIADRYLSNVDTMKPAEIGYEMTKTTGVPYNVTEKDNLFTVTATGKDKDGNPTEVPIMQDVTKDQLKATLAQHLNMSAAHRAELANASSGAGQKVLESRSQMAERAAQAQALIATAAHSGALTTQVGQSTSDAEVAAAQTKLFNEGLHTFSDDSKILTDPQGFDQFATEWGVRHKDEFLTSSTRTGPDGFTPVKESVNDFKVHAQNLRDYWYNKNPYSANGLARMVKTPDGSTKFAVVDTNGNIVGTPYDRPEKAQEMAQQHYLGKDPVAMGKLVTAALEGAKKGKGGALPPPPPATAKKPAKAMDLGRMNENLAGIIPGGQIVAKGVNAGAAGLENLQGGVKNTEQVVGDTLAARGGAVSKYGVETPGLGPMRDRHYVLTQERLGRIAPYQKVLANPKAYSDREVRVAQKEIARYNAAKQSGWVPPTVH